MTHPRYGNLDAIWRKTGGRCHLCHQKVEVCTHGLVSVFGRDAATVDHLRPQSLGGQDDFDNLLPAHHGCNAARGNGPATLARLRLAGTASRPLSTGQRVGLGVALGAVAGVAFAKPDEAGRKVFNPEAAFWTGLLATAILS